jgi:nitric oxide reductase subunit B
MRFNSQRVAYWFFATCMLLLSLQIVYGFIMAFAHAGYDVLHPLVPFNVARAAHNNLLLVWLLSGFMGAASEGFELGIKRWLLEHEGAI